MIDYKPNIQDIERKADVGETLDNLENKSLEFDALDEYEMHSPNIMLQKLGELGDIRTKANNPNLYEEEAKLYGDILNYESQNLRITSIAKELEVIGGAISTMMYGKIVSSEEAKEEDDKLFKKLRGNQKANATNLYYLSKLLALSNSYFNSLERHIENISNINMKIHYHTLKERHTLIQEDDADCIQCQSKNDLSEQLDTANFISNNFIVKNYLCDIYNNIVSYSKTKHAFKKTNTDIDTKYDMLSKKEMDLKKSFEDAIKVIEYAKFQNDAYTNILYERSKLVESFYDYDN